jgi:hypothetical protein
MERGAQTRKLLLQKKIKLRWLICQIEDYVVANMCFKCFRFSHRIRDCRRGETCTLCAGKHRLGECTASPMEFKCINSLTYNKYKNKNICTNHSSLDKNCPFASNLVEVQAKHGLLKWRIFATLTQYTEIDPT